MQSLISFFCILAGLSIFSLGVQGEELLEIDKDSTGEQVASVVFQSKSVFWILSQVASHLKYELSLPDEARNELQKLEISVCLKKRPISEVLEFLTGAGGYSFRPIHKGIVIFKNTGLAETPREIIAGYKKFVLLSKANKSADERIAIAYFSMGCLFYLNNKPDSAYAEFNVLQQEFPEHPLIPHTLVFMARCLIQTRQYEKARSMLNRFFNNFPKNEFTEEAFLMLAQCYEGKDNSYEARKIYEYMIQETDVKDKASAAWKLGRLLLKQGEYTKALGYLDKALSESPPNSPVIAKAMCDNIECFLSMGQKDKALDVIGKFYANFSAHPLCEKVRLWHVNIAFMEESYWNAYCLVKPLLKSADIKIRLQACVLAAKSLVELDMLSVESSSIEEGMKDIPVSETGVISTLYELALTYQKAKQWQKAKSIFQELIGKDTDAVYLRIMECDYESQDYRGCLHQFQSFKEKITTSEILSDAFYLAGKCWMELGETEKAREAWNGQIRH